MAGVFDLESEECSLKAGDGGAGEAVTVVTTDEVNAEAIYPDCGETCLSFSTTLQLFF